MTSALGFLILLGAVVWPWRRFQRDRERIKATVICLICVFLPLYSVLPAIKIARVPAMLLLSVWSLTWSASGKSFSRNIAFSPTLLAFLALMIGSILWDVNMMDGAMRGVSLLLLFLFIFNLLRTTDPARLSVWLSDGLLYASYATIAMVILKRGASDAIGSNDRFQFSSGMVATGTASICLMALVRLSAEAIQQKGRRRLAHWAMASVVFAAIIATGTRAAMAETLLAFPLIINLKDRSKSLFPLVSKYALLFLCGMGVLIFFWSVLDSSTQTKYLGRYRLNGGRIKDTRSMVWKPALEKAKEKPLLGRGVGSSSYFTYEDSAFASQGFNPKASRLTVHNQYIEVFYEFGLIGLAIWLLLCVSLIFNSISILTRPNEEQTWIWRMFAIFALLGILEGFTHGGQIASGNLDTVRRWLINCCVLGQAGLLSLGTKKRLYLVRT